MENARICPSALDHRSHPTLETCYTTTHCPYFIFSLAPPFFLSFSLSLFLSLSFSFIPWILFNVDERRTRKEKKLAWNSSYASYMHPSLYLYPFSLIFHFHFFFFFSQSPISTLPPRIIITTLFSLRDNLRSSVEARRNVTGCFGGTRINLARRE